MPRKKKRKNQRNVNGEACASQRGEVGQVTLPVARILGKATAILLERGFPDALVEIESLAERDPLPIFLTDRLLSLAIAVVAHHPKCALDVCTYLLNLEDPPVEALLIAGSVQDRLGDRLACAKSMRSVLTSDRAQPVQRLRAANLLVRFGEQELALTAGREAFVAMGRPLEHAATLLYIAQVTAEWPLVDQLTAQLRAGYAAGLINQINESPRTHLLWCDDERVNIDVLSQWSKRNLPEPIKPAPKARSVEGRRLRVGYLSSDFREHPTARLILGVLRHHNRSAVELFMYCSGWNDGSPLRKDVEAQFDHIHSVSDLSDEAAAELMRSHAIDVLVELNGPTRAHRMGIMRHRPAPVQIDYLGWPGSVGGRVVDYVIGDNQTIPRGSELRYPEKVIRLTPTYQANDHATFERAAKPTRKEVGLPEDPSIQILGMFNAINKVHQEVWDTWMSILRTSPNAMLWILDPGPVARQAIARAAQKAGVAVSRILASPKLPHAQHLMRLQCCDLMLDPWPYGGHTSTSDALFAGVPVLALEGKNFASRVSTGLLRAMGLDTLVCITPEEYVRQATELLQTPAVLKAMGQRLIAQGRTSAVFDAASRAAQLERAYKIAVERAAGGLAAEHINPKEDDMSMSPEPHVADAKTIKTNNSRYRVAVITPYFRIDPEKFRRCCASVAAQTFNCDHILVADGEPQSLPDNFELTHICLPQNIGNSGASPRGFGAQYAFVQGYDAVAFLDADNWYDLDHIELAVRALEERQEDVVFTRRHIVFPDGDVLKVDDPSDINGKHVDTSCYVFSKRAAYLMAIWAMYPKEFGAIEDRIMRAVIARKKLKTRLLAKKTIWYETNWPLHYSLAQKPPVAALHRLKNRPINEEITQFLRTRCGLML